MSTSPRNHERWTPLQALAWVATRDRSLVEDIGRGCEGEVMTPTWLIVAAKARLGISLSLYASWKQLTAHIAAGDIHADGQPCLPALQPEHRQRLTIEARDLDIEIDRHGIDRKCVLIGPHESQRRWLDVELSAQDLRRIFPNFGEGKNRGGAPERFDWPRIRAYVEELIQEHGYPSRSNRRIKTQADIERAALQFCSKHLGSEPGDETMRTRVRSWLKELRVTTG